MGGGTAHLLSPRPPPPPCRTRGCCRERRSRNASRNRCGSLSTVRLIAATGVYITPRFFCMYILEDRKWAVYYTILCFIRLNVRAFLCFLCSPPSLLLFLSRRNRGQSNRPLDSKVQEAQRILAKAIRRGGKRVLLPGLELRCGYGYCWGCPCDLRLLL